MVCNVEGLDDDEEAFFVASARVVTSGVAWRGALICGSRQVSGVLCVIERGRMGRGLTSRLLVRKGGVEFRYVPVESVMFPWWKRAGTSWIVYVGKNWLDQSD